MKREGKRRDGMGWEDEELLGDVVCVCIYVHVYI